jgi:hypothetical protein
LPRMDRGSFYELWRIDHKRRKRLKICNFCKFDIDADLRLG